MVRQISWAMGVALLAVGLAVVSSKVAVAQGSAPTGTLGNSAGLRLTLSTSRTTFRQGEVIPLELSFTSSTPHRYQIDTSGAGRIGWMDPEQVLIDPQYGTSDPMQLYLSSLGGMVGDRLYGLKFLSATPTTFRLVLNEWVRFDRPGTYSVTVISSRASDSLSVCTPNYQQIKLKSNPVTVHIIAAGAAWQQAEMGSILKVLNSDERPGGSLQDSSREQALEALRFLGTADAARELALLLRGENNQTDWNCMYGLIGSPHREAGLEEMNKLLDDPDFPVSDLFLSTMAILPLNPDEPPGLRVSQRVENLRDLRQRLAGALSYKRGKAFAVSLDTVMSSVNLQTSPALRNELVPELIDAFRALPVDRQVQWLRYGWQKVEDPAWLPLLRNLALHYVDFPSPTKIHSYESLQLSAAALTRWYDLDPEGARGAVIAEIVRPKPRYDATVLGLLPDKSLPQAENLIADHFVDSKDYVTEGNLASLLFRYADASVLPEVLPKVADRVGKWACKPQDDILAYLLKVNPEAARPLIERAIEARGPGSNACRHGIFGDIAALQNSPVLEKLAVRSLYDPDPEVAAGATAYLGVYGSVKDETALWNRYEDWTQEWSGRASELRFVLSGKNAHLGDALLGPSLARALATGTNWLSDENTLQHIEALGADADIKQNMEAALRTWRQRPFTIVCIYVPDSPPIFTVAQYQLRSLAALETKLKQFPRETKFVIAWPGPEASASERHILGDILDFAQRNGISVTEAPRP